MMSSHNCHESLLLPSSCWDVMTLISMGSMEFRVLQSPTLYSPWTVQYRVSICLLSCGSLAHSVNLSSSISPSHILPVSLAAVPFEGCYQPLA